MTCRDRLKADYPHQVDADYTGGCYGCPHDYGYASKPEWCAAGIKTCTLCWDREVKCGCESAETKKDRIVIVKLNVAAKADRYNAIVEELTKQLNDGLIVLPPFCELVFVSDGDLKFDIQDGGSDEES